MTSISTYPGNDIKASLCTMIQKFVSETGSNSLNSLGTCLFRNHVDF